MGTRRFVPDEFVSGVLDYFTVGFGVLIISSMRNAWDAVRCVMKNGEEVKPIYVPLIGGSKGAVLGTTINHSRNLIIPLISDDPSDYSISF